MVTIQFRIQMKRSISRSLMMKDGVTMTMMMKMMMTIKKMKREHRKFLDLSKSILKYIKTIWNCCTMTQLLVTQLLVMQLLVTQLLACT